MNSFVNEKGGDIINQNRTQRRSGDIEDKGQVWLETGVKVYKDTVGNQDLLLRGVVWAKTIDLGTDCSRRRENSVVTQAEYKEKKPTSREGF